MTHLYNCKSEIDKSGHEAYRITKFDEHMDVESSYLTDGKACDCPAGVRPNCRHREMLPKFIHRGAINTHWFYDFDRGGWVSMGEPADEVGSDSDHYQYTENNCPGHVGGVDLKVCMYCGVHSDSLRPDDDDESKAMVNADPLQPQAGPTPTENITATKIDERMKNMKGPEPDFEPLIDAALKIATEATKPQAVFIRRRL